MDDYIVNDEDEDEEEDNLEDLLMNKAQLGSAPATKDGAEETKSKPVQEAKPSVGGSEDIEEAKVTKIKKGKAVEEPARKATATPVVNT